MIKPENLTPRQRDVLRSANRSHDRSLQRICGGMWKATNTAADVRTETAFTVRTMRMLERAWLIEFDNPQLPRTATLTSDGLAIAQQLHDADAAQAVAA